MAVEKRGPNWLCRVYVGNGKRDSIYFGPSEKRAREAQAKWDRNETITTETCDDFAVRWLTEYVDVRPSTFSTYYYALSRFREDFCGTPLLGPLSRSPWARRSGHKGNDRQIARLWATENYGRRSPVRAMFEDAKRDGLISDNPFANLRLPGSRGRKDLTPLRGDELHRLADLAYDLHDDRTAATMYAAVLTLGYVGLRTSELFALRWSDLEGDELRISRRAYKGEFGPPKNGRTRIVICPAPAREAIAKVTRRIGQELIFVSPRGKLFASYTFARYFDSQAHRLEAGLTMARREDLRAGYGKGSNHITPHALRHHAATWLIDHGVSAEDVALQLGHEDGGQLVRELYAHPSDKLARDRIRRAFGENVAPLRSVDADSEAM